ncbi:MAG TPA: hypothetical protein VG815_22285, partial [Chloroflexota bacterium]|nr:hypothetical protein [Chloroflexota bacterium]
ATGAEIPQSVSIQVKVTNNSKSTFDSVQLTSLEGVRGEIADLNIPIICDLRPLNPKGNCADGPDGTPLQSSKLGSLAPGASKTVTYPFKAQGDGTGEIDALASAIDPASPKQTLEGFGSTRVEVDPTSILYLDLHGPSGTANLGTVPPGGSVAISGSLVNVTNSYKVDLDTLQPTIHGNAGDGLPTDDTSAPAPSGFPYPLNGEIDPGDTKTLGGTVTPAPNMTDEVPTGSLIYQPSGLITAPDGTKRTLDAVDTILNPQGGELRLTVAGSVPPGGAADLKSKVWYFTVGFFKGAVGWAENMLCAIPTLLVTAAKFLVEAPISLLQYLGYLATTWGYLQAKGQGDLFVGTIATEAADHLNMKAAKVATAMVAWLDHMRAAWNAGDSPEVYDLAGQVGANVVLEALLWYFTAGAAGAAKGGAHVVEESVSLAEKEQGATFAKRVSEELRRVEAGDDLLAFIEKNGERITALAAYYGVSDQEIAVALKVAEDMNVQIAFRARNPLSLEQIYGSLKALVKPENFKVKTVSDIDLKYLGYPTEMTVNGIQTTSEGLLLMKKPISEVELLRNLKGASGSDSAAAFRRWRARVAEWDKFESGTDPHWQFKKWSDRGWINIAHDREINGIGAPNGGSSNRRFQLAKVKDQPTETYIFKMGDTAPNGGVLRPITGDIDCVAITRPDGTALTAKERLAVYEALQNSPFQMQHGEELSWINQGERNKLLADHYPGGEPLAFVMPDGSVRAGFINPQLTTLGRSSGGATKLQPIIWADGAEAAPLMPPLGTAPANLPTF